LANMTLEQPVAKSPIVDKYRSRLKLTYRTNLTGTPAPQTLPFRVLVLGQFEGTAAREAHMLEEPRDREVHSIVRGSLDTKKVDDFIKQLKPWVKVPAKLAATVPGEVRLFTGPDATPSFTLKIGAIDVAKDAEQQVAITGTAQFKSDKTANGVADIVVNGIGVEGSMTVVGLDNKGIKVKDGTKVRLTFTRGITVDVPPPQLGAPVGLVTAVLPALELDAANVTFVDDPSSEEGGQCLKIAAPQKVAAERTLPFASLDDFSPDGVAERIPELHRLHVIRDLILDLASTLRNNPELRKVMRDGLTSQAAAFKDLRTWALETYKTLVVAQAT